MKSISFIYQIKLLFMLLALSNQNIFSMESINNNKDSDSDYYSCESSSEYSSSDEDDLSNDSDDIFETLKSFQTTKNSNKYSIDLLKKFLNDSFKENNLTISSHLFDNMCETLLKLEKEKYIKILNQFIEIAKNSNDDSFHVKAFEIANDVINEEYLEFKTAKKIINFFIERNKLNFTKSFIDKFAREVIGISGIDLELIFNIAEKYEAINEEDFYLILYMMDDNEIISNKIPNNEVRKILIKKLLKILDYTFTLENIDDIESISKGYTITEIKKLLIQDYNNKINNEQTLNNKSENKDTNLNINKSSKLEDINENQESNSKDKKAFEIKDPKKNLNNFYGSFESKLETFISSLSPENYQANSIIFYGPPGTGKSSIGELIATLTNSKFIHVYCSEFVTIYQGSGADNITKIFDFAKKLKQRVVILFDEVDLLTTENNKSSKEYDNAIGQLLKEVEARGNLITCIFTTNHFDSISKALKDRSKKIEIGLPNLSNIKAYIKEVMKKNAKINLNKSEIGSIIEDLENNTSYRELNEIIEQAERLAKEKKNEFISLVDLKIAIILVKKIKFIFEEDLLIDYIKYLFHKNKTDLNDNDYLYLANKIKTLELETIKKITEAIKSLADLRDSEIIQREDLEVGIFYNQKIILPDQKEKEYIIKYFLQDKPNLIEYEIIQDIAYETIEFNANDLKQMIKRATSMAKVNKTDINESILYLALYFEIIQKEKEFLITKTITKNSQYLQPTHGSVGLSAGPLSGNLGRSLDGKWIHNKNISYKITEITQDQQKSLNSSSGDLIEITRIDKKLKKDKLPGNKLRLFAILYILADKKLTLDHYLIMKLNFIFSNLSLYAIKQIIEKTSENINNNRNLTEKDFMLAACELEIDLLDEDSTEYNKSQEESSINTMTNIVKDTVNSTAVKTISKTTDTLLSPVSNVIYIHKELFNFFAKKK